MGKRLMRMAMTGAARWAGNRAAVSRMPALRVAGRGLATAAWAVPLGLYVVRKLRNR